MDCAIFYMRKPSPRVQMTAGCGTELNPGSPTSKVQILFVCAQFSFWEQEAQTAASGHRCPLSSRLPLPGRPSQAFPWVPSCPLVTHLSSQRRAGRQPAALVHEADGAFTKAPAPLQAGPPHTPDYPPIPKFPLIQWGRVIQLVQPA